MRGGMKCLPPAQGSKLSAGFWELTEQAWKGEL